MSDDNMIHDSSRKYSKTRLRGRILLDLRKGRFLDLNILVQRVRTYMAVPDPKG